MNPRRDNFLRSRSGKNAPAGEKNLPTRVAWLLLRFLFILIGVVVLLVAFFRFVPVPFSAFMVQRWVAARFAGDTQFSLHYKWVSIDQMSPYLPLAVVAAEDQRFPAHHGFDFDAISDALRDNRKRARPRGASTISQQVTKNLFLWPGGSFFRKGMEAGFTLLLEGLWSKRRLLEVYLNIAEFGPGLFGVDSASRTFFKKPPGRIGVDEASLLAAVLPSPLRYDAGAPSPYVKSRARHIKRQMEQLGGPRYLRSILAPAGTVKARP